MLDWERQIIDRIVQRSPSIGAAIAPETRLDDLGIDSLDQIELIFELEEHFDVSLPYNANEPSGGKVRLETVGDFLDLVADQLGRSDLAAERSAHQTEPSQAP